MDWRQFVMDLGPLAADDVEAVLARHGAHAVTLSDAGSTPVLEPGPGETPLWRDTRITGLFTPDADFAALRADIRRTFQLNDLPAHRIDELPDRVWEREWLQDFRPMQFGRLWICPTHLSPDTHDAVVVRLDPGLAFGTGTHPTTALCLAWIAGQDLRGKRVLDFGCGSGILAIAALKLGADSAAAIDIDPQALTATRNNAAQNGVEGRLVVAHSVNGKSFDIVIANILAGPIIDHAAALCALLADHGQLVLSGILPDQAGDVQQACSRWIDFETPTAQEDWVRLAGRKR